MTPTDLRRCLGAIGWSQRALAAHLGIEETRTRRWASGRYPIPENVAAWLTRLALAHDKAGLPVGWTREPQERRTAP